LEPDWSFELSHLSRAWHWILITGLALDLDRIWILDLDLPGALALLVV